MELQIENKAKVIIIVLHLRNNYGQILAQQPQKSFSTMSF